MTKHETVEETGRTRHHTKFSEEGGIDPIETLNAFGREMPVVGFASLYEDYERQIKPRGYAADYPRGDTPANVPASGRVDDRVARDPRT